MAIRVTQVGAELIYGVEHCGLRVTQVGAETIGPCEAPYVPPPESTPPDAAAVGNVLGRPVLHVGLRGSEPAILRVGQTFLDDGECYTMLARTRRTAPAGAGGEAIFTGLYLATVHFLDDVSLFVTPIVDGVRLETQRLDLLGIDGSAQGEERQHELSILAPYMEGLTEQLRYAPRGAWFQVEFAALCEEGIVNAAQYLDTCEVEYEVVRESMGAIT